LFYGQLILTLISIQVKNNTAKLCDLGFARMGAATTGIFVGTMTHMSPELLKHENYTFSSDIYSLAILLWELWYGHYAYTESDYQGLTTFQLLQAVSIGHRPKLGWKFGPTKELAEVITVCWHEDPPKRPSAQEVGTKLRQIFKGYHNEDI
jgi:serine/threonine protein kinase